MATLKSTNIVCPDEPTPDEIMYLNACDQIKDITHAPTLYFYKNSSKLESLNVLSSLKNSLSKVLVPFHPLAGRLKWAAQGGSRVELHCNGKGVPVFEAESDLTIEDFGEFNPTPTIQTLIPFVSYTNPIEEIPLVIVQLTRFRCGGVSIGLGISHVIADALSSMHFVDEWTKFARGLGPVIPPFLDRTIQDTGKRFGRNCDSSVLRPPPTLISKKDGLEQKKKPITIAFLKLNKIQIEKLQKKANMDFNKENGLGYGRFEAIGAHIWRCTSKARGHVSKQETSLHFVVDFRSKMKPALPKNYFGNALIRVEATSKSGSLVSSPIGMVCEKIRAAVEKVTDDAVRGYMDCLKELPDVGRFRSLDINGRPKGDFYGNPNLAVISWMDLPLYGTDFGWGSEVHLGPGLMGFDGKTFLIPGRDGDDAFKVAIWLQEEHMGAFKKCFYDDIWEENGEFYGWQKLNCASDPCTYDIIMINMYGDSEQRWIEKVAKVLVELKDCEIWSGLCCYNTLIKAYCNAGMVEDVALAKEIRENGIVLDRLTYSKLITALRKNDMFLESVKWSLWMKQLGYYAFICSFFL